MVIHLDENKFKTRTTHSGMPTPTAKVYNFPLDALERQAIFAKGSVRAISSLGEAMVEPQPQP